MQNLSLTSLRPASIKAAQPAGLPPLPAPTVRAILARCIAVWTTPRTGSV